MNLYAEILNHSRQIFDEYYVERDGSVSTCKSRILSDIMNGAAKQVVSKKPILYTTEEKLADMIAKNPAVKELIKEFDLEFYV